ncbi:hypothetical protein GYMLUDRAFT_50393, partial [Collybiopsis luxurians FD-317 M1]
MKKVYPDKYYGRNRVYSRRPYMLEAAESRTSIPSRLPTHHPARHSQHSYASQT